MDGGQAERVRKLVLRQVEREIGARAETGAFHPRPDLADQVRHPRQRRLAAEVARPFRKNAGVRRRVPPEGPRDRRIGVRGVQRNAIRAA